VTKPKPEQPEPQRAITPEQYERAVEAAAVLRKEGKHEQADEMMGLAMEARRLDRDARLVATEYGRYPEDAKTTEGEGN
jgi:hypothetical protein